MIRSKVLCDLLYVSGNLLDCFKNGFQCFISEEPFSSKTRFFFRERF